MNKSRYLTTITSHLERLLVFKQVFNEYIVTCENINCGHCLASENLPTLRDYFMRNLLRFQPFIDEFKAVKAPEHYDRLHQDLLASVSAYKEGIFKVLNAIDDDTLDPHRFEVGKRVQADALEQIDSVFIDRIRVENGVLCG